MTNLPNTSFLAGQLSEMLSAPVEIVSRKASHYQSTFPVEIITCRTSSCQFLTLWCKYVGGLERKCFGHRGGVGYETELYSQALVHLPKPTVKFYGSFYFNGETCLVLEYLKDCSDITLTPDPDSIVKAARWIGSMHAFYESKIVSFAKVYDETYYKTWVNLVEGIDKGIQLKYPWLSWLCNYFIENLPQLISAPQTLIHGEYYPRNILIRQGNIYPVDWESAAIAPGEIDLASLIEGWDHQTAALTIEAYKASRWPASECAHLNFEQTLLLAQIYFHFRWLGEFLPAWKENPKKFEQLFELAKRAGFLSDVKSIVCE